MEAACERLLHPSVKEKVERARHRRLLQVLLLGPVLGALAAAQAAVAHSGGVTSMASGLMVFGLGLLGAFALIATGRRRLVEPAALGLAAVTVAVLVAAGGGLASPLALLAVAPAAEAGWIARSRKAAGFGAVAGLAAIAGGAALSMTVFAGAGAISAWQWLVPAAYAATLLLRLPLPAPAEEQAEDETDDPSIEEIIGAAVLRLQENGDVVQAAGQADRVFGVAPEMLLGTGLFDRIHVGDRVAYLTALADLREGAARRTLRLRVRTPVETGVAYRTLIADIAAAAEKGELVAVLRDDAVSAELQAALERAKEEADGAMLARNHFMASVSHELRTPLNAILGFSDVLANEMFGRFANDKQREYVGLIREASSHLLSVVNAILDVSKLQSGSHVLRAESFDFAEAVRLCLAMSAREAEAKSVTLRAEIEEDVGTVRCDRRALQQVLINLLSNAVKFTPSGEVKVTARRSGDRLEMTVSDTGIGISAEDLERVGTPFMQVQNRYTSQGTGLGLALVKGLVGLQGGGMSIESAPGAGTRVHVSLPAGAEDRNGEVESVRAAECGARWNDEWSDDALRKTA